MPSTAELITPETSPGIVRRFWWRTNQQARLAIACLGLLATLAPLATAGAADSPGDGLAPKRGSAALEAALNRGDAIEVTVYTVSGVDSFEGMEPATGLFFDGRVAGLRRIADCWSAESRAAAEHLLSGKNVWLAVRKDGISGSDGSDGIAVDVRLPNGADYARTVVSDGAAMADVSARGELADVESAARQERRGLWAADCSPSEATATASSTSPSSTPVPTTTTTTTEATTTKPPAPSTTSPPSTSTTRPSSPPDDEWIDARLGKACLFEGSRRTSPKGNELVCARNDNGQLRWRRA